MHNKYMENKLRLNKFAEKLKDLRYDCRMSQTQLAKELNVSKQTINMWEHGLHETDFDMLIRIAEYFDVTTDFLLGWER